MEIKITLEEVKANHPELVNLMIEKIRNAKSKDKENGIENFEWFYSYGVSVRGGSFGDMMREHFNPKEEKEKSTQEILAEQLESVIGLSLVVSVGRLKRYHIFPDKPRLFIQKYSELSMKGLEEKNKEQDRLSKLTPEERDRETKENINQLFEMGEGSFVGFNVGPEGIKSIKPEKIEYNLDDILDKIGRVGMDGLTAGEKEFLKNESA